MSVRAAKLLFVISCLNFAFVVYRTYLIYSVHR